MYFRVLVRFASCLVVLMSISVSAHAVPSAEQRKTVIGTSEITNNLTRDLSSNGVYDVFLRKLKGVELVFAPYGRLDILFDSQQIDCLFPGSTTTMGNTQPLIESQPLNQEPAYIFSVQPYNTVDDFHHRRIAIRRGMTIGGIRDKIDAEFIELESDNALVKFIELGRADAFVAYLQDVKGIYQKLQLDMPYYIPSRPLYLARESFVCHQTEGNEAFIQRINKLLK